MSNRLHINLGLDDLKALAKKNWSDLSVLRTIEHELTFRSTPGATRFERELKDHLRTLQGSRGGASGRASSGPSEDRSSTEIIQLRAEKQALELKIVGLERELAGARGRIAALERDLTAQSTPNGALYRKVGLHEDCPGFVLEAVRKAYMKEFHPDRWPADHKALAHEKFVAATDVIDKITDLRGQ